MKKIVFAVSVSLFTGICFAGDPPKPYPLKTCLVSGEGLDAMGKPAVIVHEGQEMKFCCKKCITKFNVEPAKYIAEMKAANKS